jgi:S1-C subfamily serine protease
VRRGYLGVSIANLDFDGAEAFGLPSTNGALIQDVIEATPAADAGLQPGDVILEVDGHRVEETRDLIDYVSAREPGTAVSLKLVREGEEVDARVELRERGELGAVARTEMEETEPDELEWLGIQYQDLTRDARAELDIQQQYGGVLVRDVAASSPLYEEQVRPGQVISEVNGRPVGSVRDFEAALEEAESGDLVRLYVLRFGPGGSRNPFFAIVRKP